jgi:hypothetical protein
VNSTRRLHEPAVVAAVLMSMGCNSLFDIERHTLAPLEAGDAAAPVEGGLDTSHDAASRPVTASDGGFRPPLLGDAALGGFDAGFTAGADSTRAQAADTSLGDSSGDLGTPGENSTSTSLPGASNEQGTSAEGTSSAPPEPAPDPRYNAPTDGPNLNASFDCSSKLDTWGHTSYCRFAPNGFDADGNPLASVGDVHLWVYWSEAAVDGWICLIDNVSNGRGIKFQVAVHPVGAASPALPVDNFTFDEPAWPVVLEGRDNEAFGTCTWTKFAASQAVDQVMVEWMDLWTSQHFDGRYFITAP